MTDRPKPSWPGAAIAAAYGAIAATLAYLLSGGRPLLMLAIMILIGIGIRAYSYRALRRRGDEQPGWKRWL